MRFARFVTLGVLVFVAGVGIGPAKADNASKLPEIRSRAAVVLDGRTGAALYGKQADEVRPIASTTKIFVAMAVRKRGIDLDGWTEISRADHAAALGGARTRLDIGQTFRNRDLLKAMLLASDNRAPTALGRAVGLDSRALIKAMNEVAKDLGLKKTRFTDTSGLRGNVSTAREMALALRAALEDPVLAEIMALPWAEIRSKSGYAKIQYGSTNTPLVVKKYDVLGGKTGYTAAAGYCFITGAKIGGRSYMFVFLGADGKLTRFADFNRAAAWLDDGAPGAKVAPRDVKASGVAKPATDAVRVRARGTAKRK
jgi:serine-type D-Ala-D-Ala endopeptidase (penicillin-binding protein 7)